MHGTRPWAYYTLAVETGVECEPADRLTRLVLAYVREHGSITNGGCQELLGLGDDHERARYILEKLVVARELMQIGKKRGTRYALPNDDISGTYPENSV